jgi:hypothetical protein
MPDDPHHSSQPPPLPATLHGRARTKASPSTSPEAPQQNRQHSIDARRHCTPCAIVGLVLGVAYALWAAWLTSKAFSIVRSDPDWVVRFASSADLLAAAAVMIASLCLLTLPRFHHMAVPLGTITTVGLGIIFWMRSRGMTMETAIPWVITPWLLILCATFGWMIGRTVPFKPATVVRDDHRQRPG